MSLPPLPPVQCLFCNHLNPGGASFCNDCGSQLQLQQCDLCGSINKRSARICYKCGAVFALSLVPGTYFLSLENCEGGGLNAVGGESTTLPESVARALHDYRSEGSPYSLGVAVEKHGEIDRHRHESDPPDFLAVDGAASAPTAPSGGGHGRSAQRTALLIGIAAVGAYLCLGPLRSGSEAPRATPAVDNRSGRSSASGEGALADQGAVGDASFQALGLSAELSPSAPASAAEGASTSVVGNSEATDGRSPVATCQAPIAALGLCASVKKGDKR